MDETTKRRVEETKEKIREFADRWNTVASVIFTAFLVIFTGLLFLTNRDYAYTARQAQRPRLGALSSDPKSFTLVADQLADVGVDYKNFGDSPALRVSIYYTLSIGGAPPPEESQWTLTTPDAECRSKVDKQFGIPVFPQGDNEWMITRKPTDQRPSFSALDVKDVLAGTKGLYLTGCIVYRDGAGNTYHTDFCMYYVPVGGPVPNVQNQFSYCPKGNQIE